jgi:hypothetical protein
VDRVGKKDDTTYLVPSQSNVNEVYEVVFLYGHKFGCQCHGILCSNVQECKHILAVQEFMKREKKQEQELAKMARESENAQRKGREELTKEYVDENSNWEGGFD